MAFAPDGTAYVANFAVGAGTTVSVFAPGSTTPTSTLTSAFNDTLDVAVRAGTGEVFVAKGANGVEVYDPGATTPNPAKRRTVAARITGIAFASNGDLYASGYTPTNKVFVFAGDSLVPTSELSVPGCGPVGLTFRPFTAELYVACPLTKDVKVFDPGATGPNAAKTLQPGATDEPFDVMFHPASLIAYIPNEVGNVVRAFPPGATTPNAGAELTGVANPWSAAVDPVSGRMFVTSFGANTAVRFAAPEPTVTSVTPASGTILGGTAVVLNGTNLAAVSAVSFGGAAGTAVTPMSATQVQVVTPAHAVGPVDVVATWLAKTATLASGFTFAAVAPGPPTNVTATPGNGNVLVSWTPPGFTGGVALTGYTVIAAPGPVVCTTAASSCLLSGLTNGISYTFTVIASNPAGDSTPSGASQAVTPVVPLALTVKGVKGESSRLPRKGTKRLVKSARTTAAGMVVVNASCVRAGSALPSASLCKFKVSSTGKVTVKTKGKRNVTVTVTLQAQPRAGNPAVGPSAPFSRTWSVR